MELTNEQIQKLMRVLWNAKESLRAAPIPMSEYQEYRHHKTMTDLTVMLHELQNLLP